MSFAVAAGAARDQRRSARLHIVDLALRDDGGAVTAAEMAERGARRCCRSQHAARAAVVAACSSLDGR